jgi:eukaryotic-like serine/threonine-protein kinase
MAFELLEGHLPFPGPDFRQQHLDERPPSVSGCPPSLASLINECLLKPGAARPTAANILARLQGSGRPTSPADQKLQEVQRAVVERQSAEAARRSAQKSKEEVRRDLFQAASQALVRITETVRQRVLEMAPATGVLLSDDRLLLQLGDGALVIDAARAATAECLAASDYEPPFDVIAYSAIAARKPRDMYDYEGRAHSLWFCDAHEEGVYRWYELAFTFSVWSGQRSTLDPFAMPPDADDAARGLCPYVSGTRLSIAWQPIPFDQGEEEGFVERWLDWFAAAANGVLSHPSTMPEDSGGKYRYPNPQRRQHS